MNIEFPRSSAYDLNVDGVVFPVVVDGHTYRFAVSVEALQDHFALVPGADPVEVFERGRHRIEAKAFQRAQTVQLSANVTLLRSADF